MREQYQSIITADGWILCAKCGHKLGRILDVEHKKINVRIEFKCQACKTLNVLLDNNDNQR